MAEAWSLVKVVLGSPAGSFAVVLGVFLLLFWGYGKLVEIATQSRTASDKCGELEKKFDARFGELEKRFDSKVESLRDDVHLVRGDIQYIKSTLNSMANTPVSGQRPMMQSNSPLSLTDVGKEAAEGMKLEEAIARNWEEIRGRMDIDIKGRNPYDIQTYCLERIPVAPEGYFDTATLDAMKLYAFKHGRTLFECLKVAGLLIRDKYMEAVGLPLSALDSQTGE